MHTQTQFTHATTQTHSSQKSGAVLKPQQIALKEKPWLAIVSSCFFESQVLFVLIL